MSLLEAGYGSGDEQSGVGISEQESAAPVPGASRSHAPQSQRSNTTQRLQRYGKPDGCVTRSTRAPPPQRTKPETEARGTLQGQPHSGAPNGYNTERAQRPRRRGPAAGTKSLVLGRPPCAPRSRPERSGERSTRLGKAPRRRENRPAHRERPDRTRHGAPKRGHKARQRGTPQTTTTAQDQVPSNNGHRVPQTREARTTHRATRRTTPRHNTPAMNHGHTKATRTEQSTAGKHRHKEHAPPTRTRGPTRQRPKDVAWLRGAQRTPKDASKVGDGGEREGGEG